MTSYLISYITILGIIALLIAIERGMGVLLQEKLISGDGSSKSNFAWLAPGVIIHELSHALFCLIFMHKIVKISLFDPDLETGTLGYVDHEYASGKAYQKIGNTFIGIAPLFGIAAVLIFIYHLLFPGSVGEIYTSLVNNGGISLGNTLSSVWMILKSFFGNLLSIGGFFKGIFFLIVLAVLASGTSLSGADIKNTMSGMPWFIFFTFLIGGMTQLAGTGIINTFSVYLNIFFSLSLIMIIFQMISIKLIGLAIRK